MLDLSIFCIFYNRKKSEMVLGMTTFISVILSDIVYIIIYTNHSKFTEISVVTSAIAARLSV